MLPTFTPLHPASLNVRANSSRSVASNRDVTGFTVRIDEEALREAHELRDGDAAMFQKFITLVNQLEQRGVRIPQAKKLVGTKNGWRLDFGRYRALFSFTGNVITVWIIFMEKDTKKDYQRWIAYLLQSESSND